MAVMHQGEKKIAAGMSGAIGLAIALMAGAAPAQAGERVIVSYQAGAADQAKSAVVRARGTLKKNLDRINAVAAELPDGASDALRAEPGVVSVQPDAVRFVPEQEMPESAMDVPRDKAASTMGNSGKTYFSGQRIPYGIGMVQADQLLHAGSKLGKRKVCIIDSGYDGQHEDLGHGTKVNGEYDSGTGWWYTDENHHGTHVAGTISALNNPGTGVVGVIPNDQLELHIVKVFGKNGWAYSSELIDAAFKCADAGANVISMSLSGPDPIEAERQGFDQLYASGILSVAAASNAGTTAMRYPAGYDSVISVGALDQFGKIASFSNHNAKVELSAPGVNVLSTVPMGTALDVRLTVGGTSYQPYPMTGSPKGSVTAPLANFGLGTAIDPSMAGKVCLIQRGSISFGTKVANCEASGGVGAIVYNNNNGGSFIGTLGTTVTHIPSVSASAAEGAAMLQQLGQMASITLVASNYDYFDGTSMATPHVSAVAALVWSYFPMCTNAQIRSTLTKTALDLGSPGRDEYYGYGLVQAKAAYDRIRTFGCNN